MELVERLTDPQTHPFVWDCFQGAVVLAMALCVVRFVRLGEGIKDSR